PAWEPVRDVLRGELEALAGPEPELAAISAHRLGDGLVIRVGLAGWARRLEDDPDVAALTEQAWTLLAR
ncbi:hypothetical protein OFB80_31875, partial [Escherichia coli]|nr:hypothetical protein [Escherichia coli]